MFLIRGRDGSLDLLSVEINRGSSTSHPKIDRVCVGSGFKHTNKSREHGSERKSCPALTTYLESLERGCSRWEASDVAARELKTLTSD